MIRRAIESQRARIDNFKFRRGFLYNTDDHNKKLDNQIEVAEYILAALEKQEPKLPDNLQTTASEDTVYGYCPNCDKLVINSDHYCNGCGQRLQWPETEPQQQRQEEPPCEQP